MCCICVWTGIGKRVMSAVCQRFWWVDGIADTALGVRGEPYACPSITLLFHPFICTIHLSTVKLSFACQGQRWRDGMRMKRCGVTGQFSNSSVEQTSNNLWLFHVYLLVRSFLERLSCMHKCMYRSDKMVRLTHFSQWLKLLPLGV